MVALLAGVSVVASILAGAAHGILQAILVIDAFLSSAAFAWATIGSKKGLSFEPPSLGSKSARLSLTIADGAAATGLAVLDNRKNLPIRL